MQSHTVIVLVAFRFPGGKVAGVSVPGQDKRHTAISHGKSRGRDNVTEPGNVGTVPMCGEKSGRGISRWKGRTANELAYVGQRKLHMTTDSPSLDSQVSFERTEREWDEGLWAAV